VSEANGRMMGVLQTMTMQIVARTASVAAANSQPAGTPTPTSSPCQPAAQWRHQTGACRPGSLYLRTVRRYPAILVFVSLEYHTITQCRSTARSTIINLEAAITDETTAGKSLGFWRKKVV